MLQTRGITKRYPGVVALAGVDFAVHPGEVVALIGENGAGKSTLIKILGGLVQPDEGEIWLREGGKEKRLLLRSSADSSDHGIGLIHQELNNLDNVDVAGNVFLGREPRVGGIFIDRARVERESKQYLERLGLTIDPRTPLRELSIAQQQMVEIAKALSQKAKYLIMDEPTSSLTAGETDRLMELTEELRSQGVGIVYVSHRLNEVKRLADRVVVLRDGQNAGELGPTPGATERKEFQTEDMVRLMVGRDIEKAAPRVREQTEAILEVKGLRTRRFPNIDVNFEVQRGEILGMAGLVGAGRTDVARALFGADPREGTVRINGQTIAPGKINAAIEAGLLLAPEDRRSEGLITSMTIRENVTLPQVSRLASGGLISRSKETDLANALRDRLGIKTPTVELPASGLSGGNQQKVVLAKWLAMEPKLMIFDEPTRGIDIGARAEIYELMVSLANEGVGILMISSDMEEVLTMSDRILVMHEGRIAGQLSREESSEESVMRLAVGSA